MIVACEAATNCSDHGTCKPDGTCQCDSQFFSADCASKLEGFHYIVSDLGFDTLTFQFLIVACEAATNCSGNGTCRLDGTCQCDSQFFAADCTSKL